jgi:hypothetical protein
MSEFLLEKDRFRDNGETRYGFVDEFLVECPKCALMAKVVLINNYPTEKERFLAPRKLVCANCGHIETCNGKKALIGNAKDWYFQCPLWLQISCCGKILWAYNLQHLDLLESYVSAKLRERKPNVNRSVASRLPNWIKRAKNRGEILKSIGHLKEKL